MWPDLVKFHHFGKYFKNIGNIIKYYLFLGKDFNSKHNLNAFGQIFIAANGPNIENTKSIHAVGNTYENINKAHYLNAYF